MFCERCRMGRTFQTAEIADMQLSAPKLWSVPVDEAMDRFVCRREGCGRAPSLLTIERTINTYGVRETVLALARS